MQSAFSIRCPADADLSTVEAIWRLRPPSVVAPNYDAVLEWPFLSVGNRPYRPPVETPLAATTTILIC